MRQYEERNMFKRHENRVGVNMRPAPSEIITILNIDSFGFGSIIDNDVVMLDVSTVNLPLSSFVADCLGSSEISCSEIYIRRYSADGYIVERKQ